MRCFTVWSKLNDHLICRLFAFGNMLLTKTPWAEGQHEHNKHVCARRPLLHTLIYRPHITSIMLPITLSLSSPFQTQCLLAPSPFQSALTVIEFAITLSQWGNFASKPIFLAVCFYTVPGCESSVNNESVSTLPTPHPLPTHPSSLLSAQRWCSETPEASQSVGCPVLDR